MYTDLEIVDRGIACLVRELGIVEAETFISYLKNEKFDYTRWRKDKYDDMTLSEIGESASEHLNNHPFHGSAIII